jgi:uncharacterized protein YfaS (alpha-2-macroglobulin family)
MRGSSLAERLLIPVGLAAVLTATLACSPSEGSFEVEPGEDSSLADSEAAQQEESPQVSWEEIERLIDEQKYQAALESAETLLEEARESGEGEEWSRALIQVIQLQTGLHGYEIAVRRLREEPWPEGSLERATLNLFYAQGLVTYLQVYSWEIRQREQVDTGGEVDLRAWTADQLFTEAQRAYREVWLGREELGRRQVGALARYLHPNNYPDEIRGTLRDAATYLWVELLANSSFWRPKHANELYRLDLEKLAAGDPEGSAEVDLVDPGIPPLVKIGSLLDDLEKWHLEGGRPQAALEARIERLRRLHGAFSDAEDRKLLRRQLEKSLAPFDRSLGWWSVGQALLAEFVRAEDEPDSQVRAREIALEGATAHPNTVGGQRCRHIVASIESPGYSLTAMASDGRDRRSIEIRHKNLERLYFRAFKLDLVALIERGRDYNLLPAHREVEKLLDEREPDFDWTVDLPATPDYRQHQTWVVPQVETPGFYLVASSTRPDFAATKNEINALYFNATEIVLVARQDDGELAITVRSGETGKPVAGVDVVLYRYDYGRRGHRRISVLRTGSDGLVRFLPRGRNRQYFVVAQYGEHVAYDPTQRYFHRPSEPSEVTNALVYTDRSVYRPLQSLFWKTVAYRGLVSRGSFATFPEASLRIDLLDPNGEVVDSAETKTNSFGSASGEFEIPAGRLLGSWAVRTSLGGYAPVRVEEYKRPTFEVTLQEPEEGLRLNRPASLVGEARYYFGLPVVSGQVDWRVTREPVYPRWRWWWHYREPQVTAQTVAAGSTNLDEEGIFRLSFVPEADERRAASGVSFRYRVSADVTDEGGETRSAERVFRLGFVTVETLLTGERGFFLRGEPVAFELRRSDLDGTPRSGEGRWRLLEVTQPEETLLPADQLLPEPPADDEGREFFRTPGDRLRSRWSPGYSAEQVVSGWADGAEISHGRVDHDEGGEARLEWKSLAPGVYRLRYETLDPFGAAFETATEFVVAEAEATPLALPAGFWIERSAVSVGQTARLFVHSGLPDQEMVLELFRGGKRYRRDVLSSRTGAHVIEIPIGLEDRGGIGMRMTALRDYQLMTFTGSVFVPWDEKRLDVAFATFRDRLRPGDRESWRVTVAASDEQTLARGSAELLAYMYDRSLDIFAPHSPADPLSLYPRWGAPQQPWSNLGPSHPVWHEGSLADLPGYPTLQGDRLKFLQRYGIGGMGRRKYRAQGVELRALKMVPAESERSEEIIVSAQVADEDLAEAVPAPGAPAAEEPSGTEAVELRTDFSETAFWEPHLLTEEDGSVTFEFTVPDSVTEWNVWTHAITRDLRSGRVQLEARSVKELMVRPYLPRFLREGDRAELKVVVSNAGEETFTGTLDLEILDPDSEESLLAEFSLDPLETHGVPFTVEPEGSVALTFPLRAPARVGEVAFKVVGRAGDWSDGELRPLPLLPGRMHLAQSRFVTLRDRDRKELHFADMAAGDDPSLLNEQLVVTLDAQLFYSVLHALPYLVNYPYECTEQTLNRFLSTGIVSRLYDRYPAVKRMAEKFSQRETRFEPWEATDPNRKMALEETPWLFVSRGGREEPEDLINVLDPRIARAQRKASLAKLKKAQTALGGFPWWPGGPPSPYMTLYLLSGFSRALEFDVEVPRPMVKRAWAYMHRHYIDEIIEHMQVLDCCWEFVTFLNYVLSSYPDESWTGGVFTDDERREMLDFSFRHWKDHSPLTKAYLALTLEREGRSDDARLVFDSVMDSAKTTEELGTYWAPEERAWLWYNDTIETHAFALRTVTELEPADARRHGLVQWLLLNKKLSHWKSTRATAEVIYSLVHYLRQEGTLGAREAVVVTIGPRSESFVFEPDEYAGKHNQIVLVGEEIEPATDSTIVVEKETPGFLFASATWHFSTEKLPEEARGDFFSVNRSYFRRVQQDGEWTLQPLADGVGLSTGDQVEVHLSIRAKHAAEYVHLRDPRPAGFEPETLTSGYKWDLGIGWYEEIRDSGTNFFFEWLPVGEYTFKYRLRANLAGAFKTGPATLQSMYAPEFTAYSAGDLLEIE